MRPRKAKFLLVCLALVGLLGIQTSPNAAEVVHFRSAVLPPSPFKLRQAKAQGKELAQEPGFPLWGHLSKPAGEGPFPALVLLHGCSGLFPSDARRASELTELGYVTLIVDSLGPRSVFDVCREPLSVVSPENRGLDAHGAGAYLQALPFVDPARIAVIGWSHGAMSALAAVNKNGVTARLPPQFRAAIAFYPYCREGSKFDLPTLILSGEADDWTPIATCQRLKARPQNAGAPIELVAYPGAFHAFDVLELKEGLWLEGMAGQRYWLQYDEAAHTDATERVKAFLVEHLSLPE